MGEMICLEPVGGLFHKTRGCFPIKALVGDRLAVGELIEGLGECLVPGDEVALEHRSGDGGVARSALADDFFEDRGHLLLFFPAVGVGGIDHDGGLLTVLEEGIAGDFDGIAVKVGSLVAAPEDEVAVGITGGGDGGSDTLVGNSEEGLGTRGGLNGVDGGDDIARGCIFESYGHGKAGGHLAVRLAFAGAGSDR